LARLSKSTVPTFNGQKPVLVKRGRIPTHCLVERSPKRDIVDGNILISLADFNILLQSEQRKSLTTVTVPGCATVTSVMMAHCTSDLRFHFSAFLRPDHRHTIFMTIYETIESEGKEIPGLG